MSHLHFVATEAYARRVIQMGEEPWRVVVSGAPSLDNLRSVQLLTAQELESQHGLRLPGPYLLVTYHPVTLDYANTEGQTHELLSALGDVDVPVLFTYPNADTGSRAIIRMVNEFAARHPRAQVVMNLGVQAYFSVMQHAMAMVGNSSSGIIEAASFRLPVVNIGDRQQGRLHGRNVIDVGCTRGEILSGLEQARSPQFRAKLADLANPYGDGHAAERIVEKLKEVELDSRLVRKHFHEH
jgi:UDP-hydrolysing UDP-N-acetyl-D-glucosamine 2-epimerase